MNSGASWKSSDGAMDQFPVGLRVLVVDDDPTCLRILEKMLKNCLYEVTTSNRAEIALKFLRDNKNGYDIVISDVHMPDMDGFKLLEHVGLEMDLPVIMMSADDSKSVVMKGVTHGACDYLIKPVRMEALKNIWQHLVRKKKIEWKENDFEKPNEDVSYSSSVNEGSIRSSKKRKDEDDGEEERDDSSTLKKPRVVWSIELHQQFVTAVNQLGIDKAVPKKILELLNVPGLTRENVASHLQKYRLYLRRLSGVQQHQNRLGGNSFVGPADPTFGPITGLDLQALAASGQLPLQSLAAIQAAAKSTLPSPSLVDQRNIFSFENPKLRFIEGQQQRNNNKQVNLLHGIPTNLDSKHLASLHQSGPLIGNMNMPRNQILNEIKASHLSTLPSPDSQPVTGHGVRGPTFTSLSQPCTVVDFSRSQSQRTDSSRMSNRGSNTQDEVKGSRDLVLNYDVFNDVINRNSARDWRMQNNGPPFEAQRWLSVQGGQSNVNIKTERLDMGFQNGLFSENFGQEDLMSALLTQQEALGHVDGEFVFDG